MDREEVEGYVERSQEIVDEEPQMDEENTKMKLVNPFIEVLGWDIYSSEVRLEYSVDIATSTTKVDYALLLEDAPVAFIEAKGLDTELSDKHESQITDYMKIDEVDWGILTNGKRFRFFKDSELFEELRLSELPENIESVRTLSKKSIETGESEKIAEKIHERKRAVSRLRNGKDEIAADVTEAVTERVGESVTSVAETEAKEFVDRVVEELENGEGGKSVRTSGEEQEKDEYDDGDDIILMENETAVASFNDDTQADTMAKAVRFLVEEKELLDNISIPYVPGDENAVLNDAPQHPDGRKMRAHREITGDHYIDTHASKEQKERRLRGLTEKCGLSAEFNW